jgi:hypothetical protein
MQSTVDIFLAIIRLNDAVGTCRFQALLIKEKIFKIINPLFSLSLSFSLLECYKAALAGLRADQMEAEESVAENYDKME